MTKNEFHKLLAKYEKGTSTPEENLLLERFLDSFQQNAPEKKADPQLGKGIYERISAEVYPLQAGKPTRRWARLSLILLLGLLAIGLWILIRSVSQKSEMQKSSNPGVYAQLITRDNEQKSLELSDGTLVELNENTVLRYPKNFSGMEERTVELQGEAFFKVKPDSRLPFIVRTEDLETRVLGTSFNVNARPEAGKVAVALVEGKVEVARGEIVELLAPGEQMTYSRSDHSAIKTSFRGNVVYAWKEDIIQFEKATVRELVKVLEEKYHTPFIIKNEAGFQSLLVYRLETEKYSLPQVLEFVSQTTDFQFFKNQDGSYTVAPK